MNGTHLRAPGMHTNVALLHPQTLDSSELNGDGIVLSLEEQLSALSLTSSPSQPGPDSKDIVALNGTRFPSQLFEETSESTKVGNRRHTHHTHNLSYLKHYLLFFTFPDFCNRL